MTLIGWIQILLYCAIIIAITPVLGGYMTKVFGGERTFLSPVLRPVEAVIYKIAGVDERREQGWLMYTVGMLLFHVGGFLILYVLMRLQAGLPFNPAEQSAVAEDLSFNTAMSFITNTNWQNYGGESTMSYLVQMLGLTHQNYLSAATGIVLAIVLIRGFARASFKTVGNFWVDVTRCTLYVLLPICVPYALFLVWQGIPQTLGAYVDATTLGRRQADHRARPGRLADRHQDARHQWRRLLQRQCGASVRKPDRAVELCANHLDLRARRGADQCVRPHGRQYAARLGRACRHGRAVPRRHDRLLLGRGARQRRLDRARPHRRQPRGQGSPLRHRRLLAVCRDHHRCLMRRGQCHARFVHRDRRHDPADQHPARRDHRRRRRLRHVRHAAVRHHLDLRRRPDGRPHAGICRQEDRGQGSEDGDARHPGPAADVSRLDRGGDAGAVGGRRHEQSRPARLYRGALCLHLADRQQRLGLRRAQRQHAVLQHHRRHRDGRRPVLDDHPDHGDRRLARRQEDRCRRPRARSRPPAACSSASSSA